MLACYGFLYNHVCSLTELEFMTAHASAKKGVCCFFAGFLLFVDVFDLQWGNLGRGENSKMVCTQVQRSEYVAVCQFETIKS